MPYPDEYDTWRCHDPETEHPGKDCEASWQHCTECDNHFTHEGSHCDACEGSGGGHVCLHCREVLENVSDQAAASGKHG